MDIESRIERAKIDLAIRYDYNVEDVFRIFENNSRGYLTTDDLQCGFECLGICISRADARMLMNRFDLRKTGCLNFQDFFDMIVPYEKDYRLMVENRRPNSCCPCRCPEALSVGTRCDLKNVLQMIIDAERKLNDFKKQCVLLRARLGSIYANIDRNNLGYFFNDSLVEYLKNNGIYTVMRDADLLFIRLDRNRNGKIEQSEIRDELEPSY